ncbi:MAG: putative transglutaminase-like cysteine proteinase [Halieaceae bacterium]
MRESVTDYAILYARRRFSTGIAILLIAACLYPAFAALQGSGAVRVDLQLMRDLAGQRYGSEAVPTVNAWSALLHIHRSLPIEQQLQSTNTFFNNRIRWMSDQSIYGQEDYWATPLETLGRLQGDCEDFSIAKYVTLLALGVSPASLRLVYVKARLASGESQAHMVLAWYQTPRSVPLILDNLNPMILSAEQRSDLQPIFSFNAQDLWLSSGSNPTTASPRARLSRWHQVLERIGGEGLSADW